MTDDVYEDLVARDWENSHYSNYVPGVAAATRDRGHPKPGYRQPLAAAHLIKQQLQETARLILGEQAASRVHLHDNLMQDGAVDRLVATLTARPTSDVCLIADEAAFFGTREHFRYDNNHNNVLQQHRYNDLNR
nr:hypothetical protein BaRGS_016102 [Batillaria attramentaria]